MVYFGVSLPCRGFSASVRYGAFQRTNAVVRQCVYNNALHYLRRGRTRLSALRNALKAEGSGQPTESGCKREELGR